MVHGEFITQLLSWNEKRKYPFGFTRRFRDRLAGSAMGVISLAAGLVVPLIAVALFIKARPILLNEPITELLFSRVWRPISGAFGFYPFIQGTLWVTVLSMILAVPPSLLTAIFLAEYATPRIRGSIKPLIDLLAGLPSVVYGVWGMLTVVPFVGKYLAPVLTSTLGFIPLFRSDNPTGYSLLAGGLVLGIMVSPIIIAMTTEVLSAVPQGLREASLALGATRWQTVKYVVVKRALSGMIAAIVLGFSRAFGETMAVLMVVGNVPQVPNSIFDPGYPLTALIANNYGEMMSVPLYDSALLCAAFLLLLVVLVFNLISRSVLLRVTQSM
jgi:phosphate transport system permease protein